MTVFSAFAAAVVILGAAGCIWTYVATKKGIAIHWIYLVTALIFGSIYLLLIPTYSTPDEEDHFKSAYWDALYKDTYSSDETPWISLMRVGDLKYDGYLDERSDYEDFLATFTQTSDVDLQEWEYTDLEYTDSTFAYTLPILGIRLALRLGLPFGWLCMLATIPNMLFFILMTTYAMYRLPYGKRTLFVIALLPITLQQTSSVSYDCPLLAASIMVTALTVLWMADGSKKRQNSLILLCDVTLFVLSAVILIKCKKGAYAPLLLLPVIASLHRWPCFQTKKKTRITLIFTGALIALALAAGGWGYILQFLTTAPYRTRFEDYGYTPLDFLRNPGYLFTLFSNTIRTYGNEWVYELFGGNLGWHNLNVSGHLIRLEFVLFVLSVISSGSDTEERQVLTIGQRLAICITAAVPCLISIVAMLFYWTEKNAMLIDGVQGRYFLPCLAAFGFALGYWKKPVIKAHTDRAVCIAAAVLSYLVMIDVLLIVPS